jgi:hypothetical protein
MKVSILLNGHCILIYILIFSAAGQAEDTIGKADPQISVLIQQLGSADYAVRQAAELALLKLAEPSLPALRAGREKNVDPEVQTRLDGLLKLYPPPRKDRNRRGFYLKNEKIATLHELFEEWSAERQRQVEVFKKGGFNYIGPISSNLGLIANDLRRLLTRDPDVIFAELNVMQQTFDNSKAAQDPLKEPLLPEVSSPINFLAASMKELNIPTRPVREDLWRLSPDTLQILEREQIPNVEEWQKMRTALNTCLKRNGGGLISLVSANMSAGEVLANISTQVNVRIFFDSPDLAKEIWEKKALGNWIDQPWQKVLAEALTQLGMVFRTEGGPENRHVLVYRPDLKKVP